MDRRAFLFLRTRDRERVAELSCERLFMRYADARFGAGRVDRGADGDGGDRSWEGEPRLEIDAETTQDLFQELERELAVADVLHIVDREWLSEPAFRRNVESRVEEFRARGGRVE